MATGFPSINDPRENDWRGLQGAIRNIRERIAQAESLLTTVQAQAGQNTSSITTLKALNRLIAQLAARVTALEALAVGGNTVTLVAGAPIALDDPVVMISQTTCAPVDVSNPERIYAVVGIATAPADVGGSIVVQVSGARTLSYGSFTAGRALYCDLSGLTEAPSYGTVAIPVGVATGAQSMWVQPAYPRLQYPSVYDATEQYLPVTWGLFRALVPEPGSPTATIGFEPIDGVADGLFIRADGAPALATTLVTPGSDSFALSTASDLGGTTDRGDITLSAGDNDTFTGSTLFLGGANSASGGSTTLNAGGEISLTSNTLAITTAGIALLTFGSDVEVDVTGELLYVGQSNIVFGAQQDLNFTALNAVSMSANNASIDVSSTTDEVIFSAGTDIRMQCTAGNVRLLDASLQVTTAGKGIDVAEGANARMGVATLSGGTVTVNTTAVTANSRVGYWAQNSGTIAAPAALEMSARTAGTSFVISSADPADDRDVAWMIFEPA